MNAKTIICASPDEVTTQLTELRSNGFSPTLAITLASTFIDRDAIAQALEQSGLDVLGATTAGEFIDEHFTEGSAAIMLMDLNKKLYRLFFDDAGTESIRESGVRLANEAANAFTNPALIVFAGGNNLLGDQLVDGIRSVTGDTIHIYGAYAGDDFTKSGTWAFTNGNATNNGLAAMIIDQDKVEVRGLATNGWKPVGTIRTITKSVANVVHTIDDQPALDVLVRFMGIEDRLEKWNDVMINIGSEFPLQLLRTDGPPVIRAPLYANMNDRSLICAGNVPEGAKVRFSLPPSFEVIQKVVEECGTFGESNPAVEAVLMFSCKTRHVALGPLIAEEIRGISRVWKAPIAGFFSYGEFGRPSGGTDEYHNNTCAVVTLRER